MAVPVYGSPQVQNTPLDAARLNPNQAANPTGAIGQGLQTAASGFQQINHEADVLRVTDAFTPLETDAANITLKAHQIKGRQVVEPDAYGGDQGASLTETSLADFDKAVEARSEGLSARQKVLFDAAAQRKRAALQAQIQTHETQQLGVMQNQIYQDRDSVLADTISKLGVKDGYPDGEVIKTNLADRVDNARRWASSQGLDPDLAEQAAKAGSYTSVINNLIAAKKPDAALGFFSEHKMELDEKTRLHLGQVITQQVQANEVQTQAQAISSSGMPLDQQLQRVDEVAKGNAELLVSLRSEVEHRFNNKKAVQNAAVQDAEGSIWGAVFPADPKASRMSINQSIAQFPDAWARLGGEGAAKLKAQIEAYGKRNENDPNLAVQHSLAYFNLINDPNFAKLTDNQIRALTPALGPQLTIQVMKDLQEIRTNPGKLQEIHLDSQVLEASAKEFGLIGGDKPNDAEKMQLAVMASQAKQIMQATGQKWTYENQRKLYRELSQQVVTDRGWLWDTKSPVFQLRQTTPIPDAFLVTVKARAAAAKVPMPSDATVYQLWFDARSKGLVDEQGNAITTAAVEAVPGS